MKKARKNETKSPPKNNFHMILFPFFCVQVAQPRAHAPGPPLPRGDRGGGQPHRLRRGGHGQAGEDGRPGEKLVAGAFFYSKIVSFD